MEIVIAAALLAVGLVLAAVLYGRGRATSAPDGRALPDPAAEAALSERQAELVRIEERVLGKEESLDAHRADVARRERTLDERAAALERRATELEREHHELERQLERVAGVTAAQ